MKHNRILVLATTLLCLLGGILSGEARNPKREFRGAWLHTVYQGQYAQKGTAELQSYLTDQLDKLKAA